MSLVKPISYESRISLVSLKVVIFVKTRRQQNLNHLRLGGKTPLSAQSVTAKVAVVAPRRSVS